MSECSKCSNLIPGRNYQDDTCGANNLMRKHPYRIHVSLFKDCTDFKLKTE